MEGIQINGLLDAYTTQVDLSQRCIIFTGENGIGKSTIVNILNCLAQLDFVELARSYFRSIVIKADGRTVTLLYKDLFPSCEAVKGVIRMLDAVKGDIQDISAEETMELLDRLSEDGYVYRCCLYAFYFDRTLKREILRGLHATSNELYVLRERVKEALTHMAQKRRQNANARIFIGSAVLEDVEGSHLRRLRQDLYDAVHELNLRPACFLDMGEHYEISPELLDTSCAMSPVLSWVAAYQSPSAQGEPEPKRAGMPAVPAPLEEDVARILKKEYNAPHILPIVERAHMKEAFLADLKERQGVEINRLIHAFYYTPEQIDEINQAAIGYYHALIGQPITPCTREENDLLAAFFGDMALLEKIRLYIKPALLKDSLFDLDIGELMHKKQFNQIHLAFYEFCSAKLDIIMKMRSGKAMLLERLAGEYITNKRVRVTPAGLILSAMDLSEQRIIENGYYEQETALDTLSYGEKKMLMLLALSIFFEELTLMVDEPELSLSIVWQERLLIDVLERTGIKKVIVSTHSPYIAADERLLDYLQMLPD
ncbi:MAG: AAA family ATPase [Christensenellales bacterium]|jgi:predicted ATPase